MRRGCGESGVVTTTSLLLSAANAMHGVAYLLSLSPTRSSVYPFPPFFASRLSSSLLSPAPPAQPRACSLAVVRPRRSRCCSLSPRPPSVPSFALGTSQSRAWWAFFMVAGLRCACQSLSVSVMYIVSMWTGFFWLTFETDFNIALTMCIVSLKVRK